MKKIVITKNSNVVSSRATGKNDISYVYQYSQTPFAIYQRARRAGLPTNGMLKGFGNIYSNKILPGRIEKNLLKEKKIEAGRKGVEALRRMRDRLIIYKFFSAHIFI